MRIVVCIKQVPDPEAPAEMFSIDSEGRRVVAGRGVKMVISPFDENAIEAGLQLKEQRGGQVTTITLAPKGKVEALKRSLHMGVDEAVLLDEEAFGPSDSHGTAYALAMGIRNLGAFDLVLCGRQAADWDAGQVGTGIAEILDVPSITLARKIAPLDGSRLEVERLTEDGYEVVESPLPALLTVTNEINTPRLTTAMAIMSAMSKQIAQWGPQDVGADPSRIGAVAARTRLVSLSAPAFERSCQIIGGEGAEEAAVSLALTLRADKVL